MGYGVCVAGAQKEASEQALSHDKVLNFNT